MIYHFVLFKFENASQKQINDLAVALRKFSKEMVGVQKFTWGRSVSNLELEKGYSEGFVMVFDTIENLRLYETHPKHIKLIKKFVDPICKEGLVFDIEE